MSTIQYREYCQWSYINWIVQHNLKRLIDWISEYRWSSTPIYKDKNSSQTDWSHQRMKYGSCGLVLISRENVAWCTSVYEKPYLLRLLLMCCVFFLCNRKWYLTNSTDLLMYASQAIESSWSDPKKRKTKLLYTVISSTCRVICALYTLKF